MLFKVIYTYRVPQGRLLEGEVLIMADNRDEVADAFFTTHYTVAGQHKIKSVEVLSTVELDTLI